MSHWVLDVASHRPDMPVTPWSSLRLGLGLWNSLPATLIVEGALFAAGSWLYASATRARDRIGLFGFAALVAFLVVLYAGNLLGRRRRASRPSAGLAILAPAILLAWATWVDRHRRARLRARYFSQR